MKRISGFPVAVVALVALLLWLMAPQESAATILITQGTLEVSSPGGHISISGDTRGFSMDGRGGAVGGQCALCSFFGAPGDPLFLTAIWSSSDFPGSFTIDGASYSMGAVDFPSPTTTGNGFVEFEGSTIAPPITPEGTATLTAPFGFTSGVNWSPTGHLPIFGEPLIGAGVATIQLVEIPGPPGPLWRVDHAIYVFLPEPGTLLLLGSGLAGLGGLAWRRHRRHSRAP